MVYDRTQWPTRVLTLMATAAMVTADETYRSRPDLAPPQLNITIPCNGRCSSGYLFVAPFTGYTDPVDHGPLQPGAYILTDTGDLVWSGFTYFSTWSGNFQSARWKGQDVLFAFEGSHNGLHGHGHGHHTILDTNYQNIRELRAGNHMLSDKHEFIINDDETTALFQIYHPLQMDLGPWGGDSTQSWIVDARFQDMNIETGEVLFEWHSLDHISPTETALPLPLGQAGAGHNSSTAWDHFHINSIAKGADGHYLLSARHASTIFKINGSDGSIIWRLGGKHSDFELGPNVTFGFQHHARYLQSTPVYDIITLFDNSVYGSESAGGGDKEVHLYPYSRGKYIRLDHTRHTATLERPALLPPQIHPPILAKSQGSLQTLPNDHALVNWGSEGQITEYDANGEPVFHAFLDSGILQDKLQNYRAFRYNWTGTSPETPAVVAERKAGSKVTTVFVSWNGDTLTRKWRACLGTPRPSASSMCVVVERTGFETVLQIPSSSYDAAAPATNDVHVYVQAIDVLGEVLTTSNPVLAGPPAPWRGKGSYDQASAGAGGNHWQQVLEL